MKITLSRCIDVEDCARHQLTIDGKVSDTIVPLCECPEDAIIRRDLIGGDRLIEYIKMGYEAGKRGEEITVEVVDVEDFD